MSVPSPLEVAIEKATNEANTAEDWALINEICAHVQVDLTAPKDCLRILLHRLGHPNCNVVLQTLTLLDACVNSCGKRFHLELCCREFEAEFKKVLHRTTQGKITEKMMIILRKWAESKEFKDDPALALIPSLYQQLSTVHSIPSSSSSSPHLTLQPQQQQPQSSQLPSESSQGADTRQVTERTKKEPGGQEDRPSVTNAPESSPIPETISPSPSSSSNANATPGTPVKSSANAAAEERRKKGKGFIKGVLVSWRSTVSRHGSQDSLSHSSSVEQLSQRRLTSKEGGSIENVGDKSSTTENTLMLPEAEGRGLLRVHSEVAELAGGENDSKGRAGSTPSLNPPESSSPSPHSVKPTVSQTTTVTTPSSPAPGLPPTEQDSTKPLVGQEMPETSKPGFFKGLFSGVLGTISDREELCEAASSATTSSAITKTPQTEVPLDITDKDIAREIAIRERYADPNKPNQVQATGLAAELRKTRRELGERGEQLERLEDRTASMANEAEGFRTMSSQLLKKYQDKKWYQW